MENYKVFQRLANLMQELNASSITLRIGNVSFTASQRPTGSLRFEARKIGEKETRK